MTAPPPITTSSTASASPSASGSQTNPGAHQDGPNHTSRLGPALGRPDRHDTAGGPERRRELRSGRLDIEAPRCVPLAAGGGEGAAATAAAAAAARPPGGLVEHVVRPGDTVSRLALQYRVSVRMRAAAAAAAASAAVSSSSP